MEKNYETVMDVIESITIITNQKFENVLMFEQYAPIIYMEGLCYYFHKILKELFSLDDDSLMISLDGNHLGTLVDGIVYDAIGDEEVELFRKVNSVDLKNIDKYFLGDREFNNELVRIIVNDIKKEYNKQSYQKNIFRKY